jgi:hypothetical protein
VPDAAFASWLAMDGDSPCLTGRCPRLMGQDSVRGNRNRAVVFMAMDKKSSASETGASRFKKKKKVSRVDCASRARRWWRPGRRKGAASMARQVCSMPSRIDEAVRREDGGASNVGEAVVPGGRASQ